MELTFQNKFINECNNIINNINKNNSDILNNFIETIENIN